MRESHYRGGDRQRDPIGLPLLEAQVARRQMAESLESMRDRQHRRRGEESDDRPALEDIVGGGHGPPIARPPQTAKRKATTMPISASATPLSTSPSRFSTNACTGAP